MSSSPCSPSRRKAIVELLPGPIVGEDLANMEKEDEGAKESMKKVFAPVRSGLGSEQRQGQVLSVTS